VRERNSHTWVATHTTRDTLFLLLSFGIPVEVEYEVSLSSFCHDSVNGEAEDRLFLLFALSFGATVAVLKRGDAVGCTVWRILVRFVWRIVEFFLLCAFTGRGGGRGAVDGWGTGSRL
jgi:hypothetical protein